MNTTHDPRDVAILALRDILIQSRQDISTNAEQIDTVLSETEQVARDAAARVRSTQSSEYNLLDLEGVGAEMWRHELAGRDAQEYLSTQRDEWDEREQGWRK